MTDNPNIQTITIGKLELSYRKQSSLYEYIDTTGQQRKLVDYDGAVSRMIEVILKGSGELEPTVVHDHSATGLPNTNLRPVFGDGSPQRPYLKG